MWFFDGKGNMVTGSFEENLKNLQIYYNDLRRENRELKDTIQKLEADKLNDERVRELTEKINYMKSYGFYLTPEDVEKLKKEKERFKKENLELEKYHIVWEYADTHIGEVATCYAKYMDEGFTTIKEICTICH